MQTFDRFTQGPPIDELAGIEPATLEQQLQGGTQVARGQVPLRQVELRLGLASAGRRRSDGDRPLGIEGACPLILRRGQGRLRGRGRFAGTGAGPVGIVQVGDQLGRGLIALLRLFGQHAAADRGQLRRDSRVDNAHVGRLHLGVLEKPLGEIAFGKRRRPGEHVIEGAAERIDVAADVG